MIRKIESKKFQAVLRQSISIKPSSINRPNLINKAISILEKLFSFSVIQSSSCKVIEPRTLDFRKIIPKFTLKDPRYNPAKKAIIYN